MQEYFTYQLEDIYLAGMPSFSLSDLAKMRFEVLSFFLVAYLICGIGLRLIWNYLASDFSWMPKIRFGKALAILGVSGLFLYVVLTMISGARELMTPGAWKKQGATYVLKEKAQTIPNDHIRITALENLKRYLRDYAKVNQGMLPAKRLGPEIPMNAWISGGDEKTPLPFEYTGSGKKFGNEGSEKILIAYEPPSFGESRYALFGDGRIELLNWKVIFEITQSQINER